MGLLAILGVILIAVGILGLLELIKLTLSVSIILIVVGLLILLFGAGVGSNLWNNNHR